MIKKTMTKVKKYTAIQLHTTV